MALRGLYRIPTEGCDAGCDAGWDAACSIMRSMDKTPPWFEDSHRLLGDTLRRFVENEVVPAGRDWEEAGHVPRDILKRMGGLGFLGLRYPEKYGGAEMNVIGTALLAEELGRSSFGGF